MLIGEVAQRSGISARMLRHYDAIGLVSPTGRTHGGYRQYSDDDIRRLFHVEGLRSLGLSLQDIKAALADLAFSPATMVDELVSRTRERVARDQELLHRLDQVRASEPTAWSDVLRTIGMMRGLDASAPSVRQRVALAMGELRDSGALVEALLSEEDLNTAGALSWALARVGDAAIPPLVAALGSDNEARRRRALVALGKINSALALAALAAVHPHVDPVVNGRAILALGASGEVSAIEPLIGLIVDGRDDVEAADLLAEFAAAGYEDSIAAVMARKLASENVSARRRLTAALAGMSGSVVTAILAGLASDADRHVAVTAEYLLRGRRG